MPNYIKNRLTIKGKNAKEIIQKHIDNEFRFNEETKTYEYIGDFQ